VRAGAQDVADGVRPAAVTDLEDALRAAVTGAEDGFRELYRDLQPRLLRYATALVGAEAEDVTAETWLQVARDLRRFTGDLDGFRGWVCTICRNRAMDTARAGSRRPAVPTDLSTLAEQPDPQDTAGDALDAIGTRWAMQQILALPPRQAEAVLLRAVVGLDAVRAGKVLGQRSGAVRVAAHRGLRRIAENLRRDTAEGGTHA
jgi:RNA polymerase sigma-70 factor (ECF subfamily)